MLKNKWWLNKNYKLLQVVHSFLVKIVQVRVLNTLLNNGKFKIFAQGRYECHEKRHKASECPSHHRQKGHINEIPT